MKPVDVKINTYIDSSKLMIKIQNLKLMIMLDYQIIKMILQKGTLQIGLKKFLWFKKLKILFFGHMLLVILKEKKFLERLDGKSNKEKRQ